MHQSDRWASFHHWEFGWPNCKSKLLSIVPNFSKNHPFNVESFCANMVAPRPPSLFQRDPWSIDSCCARRKNHQLHGQKKIPHRRAKQRTLKCKFCENDWIVEYDLARTCCPRGITKPCLLTPFSSSLAPHDSCSLQPYSQDQYIHEILAPDLFDFLTWRQQAL